jgi:hypothetical protein
MEYYPAIKKEQDTHACYNMDDLRNNTGAARSLTHRTDDIRFHVCEALRIVKS